MEAEALLQADYRDHGNYLLPTSRKYAIFL